VLVLRMAERFLSLFPAFLAGGLALVYILGAIATGSEFEGAGVDPADAVPLLSIEQLLARGIGVLVQPFGLFMMGYALLLLFATIFVVVLNERRERSPSPQRRASSRLQRALRIQAYALSAMIIVGFIVAPVERLAGLVPFVAVPIVSYGVSRSESPRKWIAAVFVVMLISVVFGLGLSAFVDPSPLPEVKLKLTSSQQIRGTYLTHSDSTWYVFDGASKSTLAFPDNRVKKATIEKRPGDSGDGKRVIVCFWEGLASLAPF
jgi:hypothetical protein